MRKTHPGALVGLLAATTALAATTVSARDARASSLLFVDFSNDAALTLSGNAAALAGSALDGGVPDAAIGTMLQLTASEQLQTGSAFSSVPIDTSTFSTFFTFRLSMPGGAADSNGHVGGDGITLALQSVSASLGKAGGQLGIGGVSPSVAVEFDTWDDNAADGVSDIADPSSNHVGVDIGGNVHSVITANVSPAMDDGNVWYAWVDYDGTTLTVSANETGVRPATPLLSYPIDLAATLGATTAYVGFTGATYASYQEQDILSWEYTVPFVDGGIAISGQLPQDAGISNTDFEYPFMDAADSAVAAIDASVADTATADGAPADAPTAEAGAVTDAALDSAAVADSAVGDAAVADGGTSDAAGGGADSGVHSGSSASGCDCKVGSGVDTGGGLVTLAVVSVAFASRRRRAVPLSRFPRQSGRHPRSL